MGGIKLTDYPRKKVGALQYLAECGRTRGYDPQVIAHDQVMLDGERMIARVRATKRQGTKPRFAVDDEVGAELTGVSSAYTVVLKLRSEGEWDPEVDHFYPIPVSVIKRNARQAGETQQVPIDLSKYSRYRNDISRLFPNSDRDGDDNCGSVRTKGNDRPVGPDWSNASQQQQSLNNIAQDYLDLNS